MPNPKRETPVNLHEALHSAVMRNTSTPTAERSRQHAIQNVAVIIDHFNISPKEIQDECNNRSMIPQGTHTRNEAVALVANAVVEFVIDVDTLHTELMKLETKQRSN